MYDLSQLQEIIVNEIDNIEFNPSPKGLYKPVKYILQIGGKRIRPALVLAACNLFKESVDEGIYPAIGFEIFHNFTLLHDDVMDNSPIRRNHKTVHEKWDVNTAILSGDVMMIKAYDFIIKSPENKLNELLLLFNKTATEVCEGQQYDMNFEIRDDVTVEEYLEMIRLKTSVLIAGSLKAGAIIGGASKEDTELIYEFGKNMGLAFQLQDDLLDVYGDLETFGKRKGGDIIEGKKTFLLINALKKSNNNDLLNIINNKNMEDSEKVEKVNHIYDALGIKELTMRQIDEFYSQAIKALKEVSVSKNRKQVLFSFAEKIIKRES